MAAQGGWNPLNLASEWGTKKGIGHAAKADSHGRHPGLESLGVRNAQAGNEMQLVKDIKGNGKTFF